MQEIQWADTLNSINHFPFFMSYFTNPVPISSIKGDWGHKLWNHTCLQGHCCRCHVNNIVWISPVAPGTSTDVLIWDRSFRMPGDFFEFGVGA